MTTLSSSVHEWSVGRRASGFVQVGMAYGARTLTLTVWEWWSVGVAAEGKTQSTTYLQHSQRRKMGHALTQALLRHCCCVMQIHRAGALHAIFFVQPHL